jgi:hypothetical protein
MEKFIRHHTANPGGVGGGARLIQRGSLIPPVDR